MCVLWYRPGIHRIYPVADCPDQNKGHTYNNGNYCRNRDLFLKLRQSVSKIKCHWNQCDCIKHKAPVPSKQNGRHRRMKQNFHCGGNIHEHILFPINDKHAQARIK